ncbi:MAG: NAD-dependent epimerase/dehydratase family protein [Sumerlaeia bacterium]
MKQAYSGTLMLTGANGFIGSSVTFRFAEAGWRVYAGSRSPADTPLHPNVIPFEWSIPGNCQLPKVIDSGNHRRVFLHLAYTTTYAKGTTASKTNLQGTRLARRLALQQGFHQQVFISSCSAHSSALSQYGRSKYLLEKDFRTAQDLVLRPALVIGPGGLFERMVGTLRKSPMIPLFDCGRQPVQVVHRSALTEVIFQAITQQQTGRLVVASPGVLSMKKFMALIARGLGKQPNYLRLPAKPLLPFIQSAEALGVKLPITAENLLGLMALKAQKPSSKHALLGTELVPAIDVIVNELKHQTKGH